MIKNQIILKLKKNQKINFMKNKQSKIKIKTMINNKKLIKIKNKKINFMKNKQSKIIMKKIINKSKIYKFFKKNFYLIIE